MTTITGDRLGGATTTIIPGADTDMGAARTVGTSAIVPQAAADQKGRIAHDAGAGNGGTLG